MEFKGIGSPKRGLFRSATKSRNQKTVMSNLMGAIAEMNRASSSSSGGGVVSETKEDNGVVRMKIKVRKEDLRQMLQVMKNVSKTPSSSSSSSSSSAVSMSLEQRLNLLKRKHLLLRGNIAGRRSSRGSWSPVLQSIPEEV